MPSYSGVWDISALLGPIKRGEWPVPLLFSTIGAQVNVAALQQQRSGIAPLSSTVAVYAYIGYDNNSGLADLYAVVATRSGSTISFGTPVVVRSGLSPQGVSICKLSSTTAFIAYETAANNYLAGRVLTVSGTSVSAGAESTISSVSQYPSVTRLTDTTALCAYVQAGLKIVVATASGTTFSWGSPATVSGVGVNTVISASALSSTAGIVLFDNASASNAPTVVACSVAGGSVTPGTPVQIEATGLSSSSGFGGISALTSSSAIAVWATDTPSNYGKAVGMTVSGTTVTVGTPITFSATSTTSSSIGAMQPITAIDSSSALAVYKTSPTYGAKFTLSGTTVSFAISQEILSFNGRSLSIAQFDASNYMMGYGQSSTQTAARVLVL